MGIPKGGKMLMLYESRDRRRLSGVYLFIDMNVIIHSLVAHIITTCPGIVQKDQDTYECTDPTELMRKLEDLNIQVLNYVIWLINSVEAKQVNIYFDGIPPIAKIHQQRIRRITTTRVYYGANVVYTSASIMPGSVLTMNLQQHMEENMKRFKIPCTINGFGIPGEGEHKIVEELRAYATSYRGTIVVAGRDNDFCLLLGMLATSHVNIDIVYAVLNIERDDITYINIIMQVNNMLRKYGMGTTSNMDEIRKAYVNLVVIITICYGNDFIPPVEFIHYVGREIFDTVLIKICESYRSFSTDSVQQEIADIYNSVGKICTEAEMHAYLNSALPRDNLFAFIRNKIGAPTITKRRVQVSPDHNNLVDMTTMDINVPAMQRFFKKLAMVSNDILLLQSNSKITDTGLQKYVDLNVMQFYRDTTSVDKPVKEYITILQWILKYYSTF